MILVGSQRGGAGNLANHLLNDRDNDHVTVQSLRGFVARDLKGAFEEAHAVSLGTRCKQFLFSLSLNPPQDVDISVLLKAADLAEERLGLTGQPRAVVIHEKNGRRHAHVVWSRIKTDSLTAINLPHYKHKLNSLSKDLYLEHGWQLPNGYKENGWKNPLNFTLAEWQQAKRLDLDPREIKQVFQRAWARSDNLPSFKQALEENGYFLAQGDRRGFVAVDIQGEVYSVARMTGLKTREVNERLGKPEALPSVTQVQADTYARLSERLRDHLKTFRQDQQKALQPLHEERQRFLLMHRAERQRLLTGQEKRWQSETQARSERLRKGFMGVVDALTGKAAAIRNDNARQAYAAYLRDRTQQEALYTDQAKDIAALHKRYASLKATQRDARMQLSARIGQMLRLSKAVEHTPQRQHTHDFSL